MSKRGTINGAKALGTAATGAIDCSSARYFSITCPAGNIALNVSYLPPGEYATVDVTQDGTGSRTITWSSGGTPALQTVGAPVAGDLQPATGANTITSFTLVGSAVDMSAVRVSGRLV